MQEHGTCRATQVQLSGLRQQIEDLERSWTPRFEKRVHFGVSQEKASGFLFFALSSCAANFKDLMLPGRDDMSFCQRPWVVENCWWHVSRGNYPTDCTVRRGDALDFAVRRNSLS
jgi:hypothetical protein